MANLSLEQCKEILKNAVENPVECLEYKIEKYSEKTLGFLGEHSRLIVKCKTENNEIIEHHFFVKTIPSEGKFREYVQEIGFFDKEAAFYKHILPKLGQKHGIYAPKCYYILSNEEEGLIVLEDLRTQGFALFDDHFDYTQWEPLLKSMAKLHSASIIYEENEKKCLNDEYKEALKETTLIFEPQHPRGKWLRNCLRTVIDVLQEYPGCNEKIEVSNRLLKFVFNKLPGLAKPSKKYRNVISHADLWKNNVLFKVDDCGHKEAVIIDYQLIRYAPPVLDVLTTVYLNSDRGFLESNFDAILNVYYSYFCTFLKMESVNPQNILPLDQFKNSVEEYKMSAIVQATFFGLIVFISEKLAKDINSNEEVFQEFTYEDRSKYIIKEYCENHDFKYKFDTLLQRLVDTALNTKM